MLWRFLCYLELFCVLNRAWAQKTCVSLSWLLWSLNFATVCRLSRNQVKKDNRIFSLFYLVLHGSNYYMTWRESEKKKPCDFIKFTYLSGFVNLAFWKIWIILALIHFQLLLNSIFAFSKLPFQNDEIEFLGKLFKKVAFLNKLAFFVEIEYRFLL